MTDTMASGRLMVARKTNAARKPMKFTTKIGANARYICTERMSELAREMSCPLWTLS